MPVPLLGWKDPLVYDHPHSIFSPGKFHGQRILVKRYSPQEPQRVGHNGQLSTTVVLAVSKLLIHENVQSCMLILIKNLNLG